MPNGILPNEGIAAQLTYIVQTSGVVVPDWQLRLWVNDYVPVAGTVVADLQEATFNGYVRRILFRANWTAPVVVAGCATTTYGTVPQQWTVNVATSQKVYGFALVDAGVNVIRFVQRLEPLDIQPLVAGNVVKLLPRFTLTSAACGG